MKKILVLAGMMMLVPFSSSADTINVDFENPPYVLGTIEAQDGWSSDGAAGSGCAVYDHAVSTALGTAGFALQSLRISNAVTSGCFGDHTFSRSLANETGETLAEGGGMSGGTRENHFEAQWQFASAVPGAEQPGLSVVASPDRGDGARMSWVQMADTPTGLSVNFYDYQDGVNDPAGTCASGDDFIFSPVVTGLDRTVPHTIKIVMDFVDGANNDVVKIYVDGVLEHNGTSWEGYFDYCEGNPTRTVDSVLFRTGGTSAPATAGFGFLIDNLTLQSGDPDVDGDNVLNDDDLCPNTEADSFSGWNKSKGRYKWNGIEWVTSGKADKTFFEGLDMAYTYGCSGEQILDEMNEATGLDFGGHYKYGLSKSILEEWHAGKYYIGPTLIETVEVPANDADGVSSVNVLEADADYFLRASGTAFACNEPGCVIEFDADYSTSDASTWVDGVAPPYDGLGTDLLDLKVDGAFVNWGTYNALHKYQINYAGTGNLLDLEAYDTFSANNSGSLFVDIVEDKWIDLW